MSETRNLTKEEHEQWVAWWTSVFGPPDVLVKEDGTVVRTWSTNRDETRGHSGQVVVEGKAVRRLLT